MDSNAFIILNLNPAEDVSAATMILNTILMVDIIEIELQWNVCSYLRERERETDRQKERERERERDTGGKNEERKVRRLVPVFFYGWQCN